jgi:hypothetical protein
LVDGFDVRVVHGDSFASRCASPTPNIKIAIHPGSWLVSAKEGTQMKTSKTFSRMAIFLVTAFACGTLNAAITIYITPDGTSSDIQMSGTFDGPIPSNIGNVFGFAFAPTNAWQADPLALVSTFSSSAATLANTTRGGSIEITKSSYGFFLNLESPSPLVNLPIFLGDVLTLTSHGPVNTGIPFADFKPGSYVYNNTALNATINTFIIVPEPSPFALAGVGTILLLVSLRKRGPNLRVVTKQRC